MTARRQARSTDGAKRKLGYGDRALISSLQRGGREISALSPQFRIVSPLRWLTVINTVFITV
jgi:hypothetical protein